MNLAIFIMSKINWNNPEERRAYHREKSAEYRRRHPQVSLTLNEEDYKWLKASSDMYGAKNINQHIKALAIEAAKLGLGEQVERQASIPKESLDEILFVLRNYANNLNQIAHHLNIRAKEERRQIVAGYDESVRIQDTCFQILRSMEIEIRSLTSDIKSS